MKPGLLLLALALCAANTGCGTFWTNAMRNISEAPKYGVDQCRVSRRNESLAREAWDEVRRNDPENARSPDYGDGFMTGFADFLESGGSGQPPAVPPFRYRLSRYQTPEGYGAIEDWYAGFRAGAAAAQASGLRDQFILPLSAPPINAVGRNLTSQGGPMMPSLNPASPWARPGPEPELPPPRKFEPDQPPPENVGSAPPAASDWRPVRPR